MGGAAVAVRVRRPRVELGLRRDNLAQEVLRGRTLLVAEGSGVPGDYGRVRIDAVDSAREGIHERAVTRWRHELAVLDLRGEEIREVGLVPDLVVVDPKRLVVPRQRDREI